MLVVLILVKFDLYVKNGHTDNCLNTNFLYKDILELNQIASCLAGIELQATGSAPDLLVIFRHKLGHA